jgi:hypothetical protein
VDPAGGRAARYSSRFVDRDALPELGDRHEARLVIRDLQANLDLRGSDRVAVAVDDPGSTSACRGSSFSVSRFLLSKQQKTCDARTDPIGERKTDAFLAIASHR